MRNKILITGICGFAGAALARWFRAHDSGVSLVGIDNLSRAGSELNRKELKTTGVEVRHGDVRNAADIEGLPAVEWVIDAAAKPSVLAGVDGVTSSRQLVEHNLGGTLNLLEYCRRTGAGLVLLSTSRVYSIRDLAALPLRVADDGFLLEDGGRLPQGVSRNGISETFPCAAPVSLYGSTKLASEVMAAEYGEAFGFPVWINRCGVMAGAGQFGTAEQGIFSYWIHAYAARAALTYKGFGGQGCQVRDALHPDDLADLVWRQMRHAGACRDRVFNVGGGALNAMSLAQLTAWCGRSLGAHTVGADASTRPFDIPWVVMDSARAASQFGWKPERRIGDILDEIVRHARLHPDWLDISGA